MNTETFRTQREFNDKYPSRFYICSNCGYMNASKYNCQKCGWRADGLLKTMDRGYKYKILETGKEYETFKPIEVFRQGGVERSERTRKSKEPNGAAKIENFESGVQGSANPNKPKELEKGEKNAR